VAITFIKSEKTIRVSRPLLMGQDLVNAIRAYEPTQGMMDFHHIANIEGKIPLGSGEYTGFVVNLLDDWRIQFEAAPGPTTVRCFVRGADIVATNSYGDDPFRASDYTYVTFGRSTCAALIADSGGFQIDASMSDDGTTSFFVLWGVRDQGRDLTITGMTAKILTRTGVLLVDLGSGSGPDLNGCFEFSCASMSLPYNEALYVTATATDGTTIFHANLGVTRVK